MASQPEFVVVPEGSPDRYVDEFVELPGSPSVQDLRLDGTRVVVLGKGTPLAVPVTQQLESLGADVLLHPSDFTVTPQEGTLHAAVFLAAQDGAGGSSLPDAFATLRALLLRVSRSLVIVVPARPCDSSEIASRGWRGLVRCLARERPALEVRLIEQFHGAAETTDPLREAATAVADALARAGHEQAGAPRRSVHLILDGQGRTGTILLRRTPLPRQTDRVGDLPTSADVGAAELGAAAVGAAELGLDRDSVVVMFGGARGITARIALALAEVSGCRLELVGRTSLVEGHEVNGTRSVTTPTSRGQGPVAVAPQAGAASPPDATQTRARQEIWATLNSLHARGSRARYHSVDVRDPQAVRTLIASCFGEHGRIDGLVYGAGVIRDRLAVLTAPRDFSLVYDTKVVGARAALEACADLPDTPRFAVLFGSIAVLGNPGQSAYAAANDALEGVGRRWAAMTGRRCLTVHWGPWKPSTDHAGMVSAELAEDFARRGLACIDPDEGARALLRELAWGPANCAAVYYAPAGWVEI